MDFGLADERAEVLATYAGSLAEQDLPAIFSFAHLCQLLGKTPAYLASVVFGTSSHYRNFTIPKRSGGIRNICAPYPTLLECQRWVARAILQNLAVNGAAHGYVSGRNIVSNARIHSGQKCLLKVDIRDFFPSVPISRIIGIFRALGYAPEISFFLARICTLNDVLPQGAATSPALSNLVLRHMDSRLAGLAKSFHLRYSRYADDLVFSGNSIEWPFANLVIKILESSGYESNSEKLLLIKGDRRKIVTGVDVTKSNLRTPRAYRREVRQQAHLAIAHGPIEYIARNRRGPIVLQELAGKLQHWITIEPESAFALDALHKIKKMIRDLT